MQFSPYEVVPYVAILDNGFGMSNDEIDDAMRYGSQSSLNLRNTQDLGRFGLGLKTASLSQCKCLTVISKQGRRIAARRWDLEEIYRRGSWALISLDREDLEKIPQYISLLKPLKQGTLVIWENLDRMLGGTTSPEKLMNKQIHAFVVKLGDYQNSNYLMRLNDYFLFEKELGISNKNIKGVVVSNVQAKSPAAALSLQSGDIITAVNDTEITGIEDFYSVLATEATKEVWYDIYRNGMKMSTLKYKF